MSKVSCLMHIVINTYCRKMTISEQYKRDLYRYMYGIIQKRNCTLLRMNGIGNHIHLLVELHASVALSDLVKSLKQGSSRWLLENPNFPNFEGWGKEYFAFSISKADRDRVINYITNQEIHHIKESFEDEMLHFATNEGFEWSDNLLT